MNNSNNWPPSTGLDFSALAPLLTIETLKRELETRTYRQQPVKFLQEFCQIEDVSRKEWIPFELWPAQIEALKAIHKHQRVVMLKARQIGFTWLALGYCLHQMILQPGTKILLLSKDDTAATDMLDIRLRGMHRRLPQRWQMEDARLPSQHDWLLTNASRAQAFPTTGGRSFTASIVVVDEADWIPRLGSLIDAVKPTVDAGGKLILLSSPDKSKPESTFKRLYTQGKTNPETYYPIFAPWHARPSRTTEWYELQKQAALAKEGSIDSVYQEYPSTDSEALAPRSLDKRFPADWLIPCYKQKTPLVPNAENKIPGIPGLQVFILPQPEAKYVLGADPAEGNPSSDDSCAVVLNQETGEEMACLAGKIEPSTFASYVNQLCEWYNRAIALIERNNHGHAVLLWLRDHTSVLLRTGWDSKPGWLSNSKGKALMYSAASDAFRDRATILHSFQTFAQLASIEGSSLQAPDGQHDDRATAYVLALECIHLLQRSNFIMRVV